MMFGVKLDSKKLLPRVVSKWPGLMEAELEDYRVTYLLCLTKQVGEFIRCVLLQFIHLWVKMEKLSASV